MPHHGVLLTHRGEATSPQLVTLVKALVTLSKDKKAQPAANRGGGRGVFRRRCCVRPDPLHLPKQGAHARADAPVPRCCWLRKGVRQTINQEPTVHLFVVMNRPTLEWPPQMKEEAAHCGQDLLDTTREDAGRSAMGKAKAAAQNACDISKSKVRAQRIGSRAYSMTIDRLLLAAASRAASTVIAGGGARWHEGSWR